jgi:hypothetical protein
MSIQKLHETLDELHRQLEQTKPIDAEARAHLQAVMVEVRQVLARADRGRAPAGRANEAAGGLVDRLRTWVERFEVEHPRLSAGLADLIESLRKL